MSTEPTERDDQRFTRAGRSVTQAAAALPLPSARDARARQQRRTTRVVAIVALVACVGLVGAVTAGRRDVGRDLAVGAGPTGAGTTPGSSPGSAPGTVPPDVTETTEIASSPTTAAAPSASSTSAPGIASTVMPDATTIPPPSTTMPPVDSTKPADQRWALVANGTYKGIGHYALFTDACRDLKQDLDLTFDLDTGPSWTLHADFCGSIDQQNVWSGEGPFTITEPGGSTLTGLLSSKAELPTSGVPYGLKVTGGTGQFAGAEGLCRLTINLHEKDFGVQPQDGTFACTVTVPGPHTEPVAPPASTPR
jgi:hypothetical protein